MTEFNYFVYDGLALIAGFVSFCTAATYAEDWRHDSNIPINIIDAHTGEIIDVWQNGKWESGD